MTTGRINQIDGYRCAQVERLENRCLLAAAGQLDTTFSGDGRAPFPFGVGVLVGVQPDGKIVHTRHDAGGFRLVRLNTDGTHDATFLGGQTLIEHSTEHFFDTDAVTGRIAMVAGAPNSTEETRIVIFNADGSPDDEFDEDGILDVDLDYAAHRIAWQGEQLVTLGGPFIDDTEESLGRQFLELRRFNSDGTPDNTFGAGGKIMLPGTDHARGELQIGPNGTIVVATDRRTTQSFSANVTLEVYRFTAAAGQSDVTFGGGAGFITVAADDDDNDLKLLAFNVAQDGSVYHLSDSQLGVRFRRFSPDGAIAATTGALDPAVPSWQSFFLPQQLEFQPDGKVLLIGPAAPTPDGPEPGWTIVRLFADGQIDTTYGAGGVALPKFGHNGRAVVQPDGKIYVSGDRYGLDGWEIARIDTGEIGIGEIRLNRKGTLLVYGTAAGEEILLNVRGRDGKFIARVGTLALGFAPSKIKRIAVFAGAGDDRVTIANGVKGAYAQGDDGFDTLVGGVGDDTLLGGLSADQLFGNDGDDILVGEGGNDYLLGGAGKDDLFGNGGADTLSGAGGNDRLFGGPDDADRILGGAGTDAAADDDKDSFNSIEILLA